MALALPKKKIVKTPAVLVLWDIENVCSTPQDVVQFVTNFKIGMVQRFRLGRQARFRIRVFHNPEKKHLERKGPAGAKGDRSIKDVLTSMGCMIVDVAASRPQQADNCIVRRMHEIAEDWDPKDCMVVLVSGDKGFIPHLNTLKGQGFSTYLMSNFDCLAREYKRLVWLEIWSFFVVAHGDLRKLLTGREVVRRGPHPSLGYRGPARHNAHRRNFPSSGSSSPGSRKSSPREVNTKPHQKASPEPLSYEQQFPALGAAKK